MFDALFIIIFSYSSCIIASSWNYVVFLVSYNTYSLISITSHLAFNYETPSHSHSNSRCHFAVALNPLDLLFLFCALHLLEHRTRINGLV